MKHTPGPWETDPEFNNECILGNDKILVADCTILHIKRSNEMIRANARLIASAPDLLETCKEARAFLEGLDMKWAIWSDLNQAIAKAEEEEE